MKQIPIKAGKSNNVKLEVIPVGGVFQYDNSRDTQADDEPTFYVCDGDRG